MGFLERRLYATAKWLSRIGMLLLLTFAAATLVDGAMRSFFSSPLDIVRDCGGVVVAVAISACFPQLVLERGNIVINFVDRMVGRTTSTWLSAFASFCTFAVCFAFAWKFLTHADNLYRGTEKTPLLSIPTAPFWYVVDANIWLCALAQFLVLIQTLRGQSGNFVQFENAGSEGTVGQAPERRRDGVDRNAT